MNQFMSKNELEIKKDQLISSAAALARLAEFHSAMKQSLMHF